MDLLHILGRLIALEPLQIGLLERICTGPLLDAEMLRNGGAFATPEENGRSKA